MIKDIIKNANLTVSDDNFIDIGYENSWYYSETTREAYNNLMTYVIPNGQFSSVVGRCVTEYRWYLNDGFEDYILVSKVDSSD